MSARTTEPSPPNGTSLRRATAIVLARAGSMGVPGKNTAPVAGWPCIAWTIAAAQRSATRVVVSTDDPGAARIAMMMRAEVVRRPSELAGDNAAIDDAARHAVRALEEQAGRLLDEPIVILYANVPVRPDDLIARALGRLAESGCDSVQSYCRVGKHHPWWTARVDEETGAVRAWEGPLLNHGVSRRQDLPPAFVPDGGVIALTRASLMLGVPGVEPGPHAFFGRDRRGIETGAGEVIDIDAPIDLVVADAVLRRRLAGGMNATGGFAA